MTYKTVLVHVDDSSLAETRIRVAADIAAHQGAHLVGAATTGMDERMTEKVGKLSYSSPDVVRHYMALTNTMRERSEEALERFGKFARNADLRSYETLLINGDAEAGFSQRARYADLAVISQYEPENGSNTTAPGFPENVILASGCPALIVPYAGDFNTVGTRPLIAWDAGAASIRAVRDALPFLRKSAIADVVVFNADRSGSNHGNQAGDDIALFLARHDVKVVVHRKSTPVDVGNALLSTAADLGSDMIVMGCYGHSRFRETLLGGVTRTVLETMTVPVLMSR